MPVSPHSARALVGAVMAALTLGGCVTGRQVAQTVQPMAPTETVSAETSASASGAAVGSDQILQISGNVVLPVLDLNPALFAATAGSALSGAKPNGLVPGLSARVATTAPSIQNGTTVAVGPAAATTSVAVAAPSASAGAAVLAAQANLTTSATAARPQTLASVDLSGAVAPGRPAGLTANVPAAGAVVSASPVGQVTGTILARVGP